MDAEAQGRPAEPEKGREQSGQGVGSITLRPPHLIAAGVVFLASLALSSVLTSRIIQEENHSAFSEAEKARAAEASQMDKGLADKDKEIERLSARLKESYEKQRRLLARSTELEAKLKAFQGTLNVSKGPLLPSRDSSLPLSVSPVFTTGETPFIKDGERWLAVRREGLFSASPAQAAVRDAFAGKGFQLPEAARKLAASPKPAAGSVVMLHPEREFTDLVRPLFKWKRQPGMIGSVQSILLDQTGQTLAVSEPMESDSWQPQNPLPRGHAYTWRIVAASPVDPSNAKLLAEGRFYLLSDAESERLAKELKEANGSALLRMSAFIRSGLAGSAEWEAQQFSEANPGLRDGKRLVETLKRLRPQRGPGES